MNPNGELISLAERSDALAQEIARSVARMSRILLLDRAWWSKMPERFPDTDESGRISFATLVNEDTARIRLIEYLQSVIVSIPADPDNLEETPNAEWQALISKVDELFRVQLDYTSARFGNKGGNEAGQLEQLFQWKLTSRWILVHGRRYPVHWRAFYIDVLLPFDSLIREVYGISGEHLVDELMKIHFSETYGVIDAIRHTKALEEVLDNDSGDYVTDEERSSVLYELSKFQKMFRNCEYFDLACICELPETLLDDLTWRSGQNKEFYGPGKMQGWLIKKWPTYDRPFVEIDGRRFCYDSHLLNDRVFTALRSAIRSRHSQFAERWDEIQGKVAEGLAFQYLQRLIPRVPCGGTYSITGMAKDMSVMGSLS